MAESDVSTQEGGSQEGGNASKMEFVARVDSLDQLPVELHSSYAQTDDGAFEFINPKNIKVSLKKEREARSKFEKFAKRSGAVVKSLFGDDLNIEEIDLDDPTLDDALTELISKKMQAKQALKPGGDDGNSKQRAVQAALQEAEVDFKRRMAKVQVQNSEKDKTIDILRTSYQRDIMDFEISKALAKHQMTEAGKALLPDFIRKELIIAEDKPNTFKVYVKPKDASGDFAWRPNPTSGEPMSVSDLVEREIRPRFPDLFTTALPASGVLGGGSTSTIKTSPDGVVEVPESQMTPKKFKEYRDQNIPFKIVPDTPTNSSVQ